MEDELVLYVCMKCNEIFQEGNLMISGKDQIFYCNNCFPQIFELKEPEEFKMEPLDGQGNSQNNDPNENSGT